MSIAQNHSISQALRSFVRQHALLAHPFLNSAKERGLRLCDFKLFAVQEMFVSVAFPAMMAEVICKIPYRQEELRYPLIVNMFEEAGESNAEDSHPNLLRKLAIWLGASTEEVNEADPLPETTNYLNRIFDLCRSRDYLEGLAAIGYGNEYLVLFEYPIFRKACEQLGCPQKVLNFFDVNIKADVAHTDNIEKVITMSCKDTAQEERLLAATDEALNARSLFYDGLARVCSLL